MASLNYYCQSCIGIFRWGVGLNNTMVEKQETAKTQWANVESAYQRRSDLDP